MYIMLKEDICEEEICLNVESKSGNEFIRTKSIGNELCCNNTKDNRKLRKAEVNAMQK